jgi:dinuclear metal center YbgI/SA1388 family protein
MSDLTSLVHFLDEMLQIHGIEDFPNACNGLQLENHGQVSRIAGAVDASVNSITKAIQQQANLLVVHHGLFWKGAQPIVGATYELYRQAIQANLAIYSAHLPLDGHPQYSHSAQIIQALQLSIESPFAYYKGHPFGFICRGIPRDDLVQRLKTLFPRSFHEMCYGASNPQRIAVVSGSCGACLDELVAANVDTFVTGEVRYSAASFAQLHRLNIFACGHYATECFGIKALLQVLHQHTQLPCDFIDDFCEL